MPKVKPVIVLVGLDGKQVQRLNAIRSDWKFIHCGSVHYACALMLRKPPNAIICGPLVITSADLWELHRSSSKDSLLVFYVNERVFPIVERYGIKDQKSAIFNAANSDLTPLIEWIADNLEGVHHESS